MSFNQVKKEMESYRDQEKNIVLVFE